jgi:hypothetical protein
LTFANPGSAGRGRRTARLGYTRDEVVEIEGFEEHVSRQLAQPLALVPRQCSIGRADEDRDVARSRRRPKRLQKVPASGLAIQPDIEDDEGRAEPGDIVWMEDGAGGDHLIALRLEYRAENLLHAEIIFDQQDAGRRQGNAFRIAPATATDRRGFASQAAAVALGVNIRPVLDSIIDS